MWAWLLQVCRLAPKSQSFGARGEQVAARYLRQLGWRILARDHRNALGEIDLIALDGNSVVFVEVKTRKHSDRGLPADAVNAEKQRRLTRAAMAYLKRRGWLERTARFDVIAILWSDESTPEITHYRHAFDASGHGQMYS